MTPNITSKNISDIPELMGNGRLEVLYNGYLYDVTDFVNKHPGGSVIKFYTEQGEDATQAIEQFHYRSRTKVELLLKSFKKRPVESSEITSRQKALTRHDALSAAFKKLFEELQAEGYFNPSFRQIFLRLLECVATLVLAFGLLNNCETAIFKFFAVLFVGFAYSRFGYLMHEGGHNSLTGYPKVDKLIQISLSCVTVGLSSIWWNSQHSRHHAMPQRLNHDVDLATLPVVAFNKRAVKDRKEILSFFVKYQAFLYWTLSVFLGIVLWKFYLHPKYQLRKKAYFEMLFTIPCFFILCYYIRGWYFLGIYCFAFFLAHNFALSHSHLEVTDKPTHWVEYCLTHTANITPSILVDYLTGYLNYQIEHHLFPTMPEFRQKEISHRVKSLAEKHGLVYKVYTYPEACRLAMTNLYKVSKELQEDDFLGTSI